MTSEDIQHQLIIITLNKLNPVRTTVSCEFFKSSPQHTIWTWWLAILKWFFFYRCPYLVFPNILFQFCVILGGMCIIIIIILYPKLTESLLTIPLRKYRCLCPPSIVSHFVWTAYIHYQAMEPHARFLRWLSSVQQKRHKYLKRLVRIMCSLFSRLFPEYFVNILDLTWFWNVRVRLSCQSQRL